MAVNCFAGEPKEFSDREVHQLMELIELGDEVDTIVLQQNVNNAKALVFAREESRLLAVATLKRPKATYRKSVSEKSDFDLDAETYPFELGYVFVKEEARGKGVSHQLVAAAIERSNERSIFATVRSDNAGMQRVLKRAGFSVVGTAYAGRKPNDAIQVLVREF